MAGTRTSTVLLLTAAGALVGLTASADAAVQVITLRSGQVGGLPGVAGQPDDIVTYRPGNPPGAPASGSAFNAADFSGAVSGPPAYVINPYLPFWTPGISDPLARWINFDGSFVNPDGTPGPGYGNPGSALYAVPFVVTLGTITSATLSIEYAVDDWLGDGLGFGPNPDGIYVNGSPIGYFGGGFTSSSFHNQNITAWVTPGLNYLYLYQRDAGALVSGLIFSARITVVPSAGPAALAGLAGLCVLRRRR